MEVNHHISFKNNEYKNFLKYIETLKRQKIKFTIAGNVFAGEKAENNSYSVNWTTEEPK